MRVLVTGSRHWDDYEAVEHAIMRHVGDASADEVVIVHGGARGADTLAWQVARRHGFDVEVRYADWDKHGRAAGPIRNQHMVSLGADVCLAFPIGRSPGTRNCMSLAKRAGIPVYDYSERGTIRHPARTN